MAERVKAMLIGRNVFIALAILTVIEYLAAVGIESDVVLVLLFLMALAKAWLIVVFFMHIAQLRKSET
jgi:heme/copper-type cytochrome/quinol oxidase subunit 4